MGADLYLPSVLHTCFTRYGRAAQLADALHCLVQGDISQALHAEGLALKTALRVHAEQQGTMSPALFDLVAEIADLAQEELTVWGNALASQIGERLDQRLAASGACPENQEPASLAHALVDLLQGLPERAIAHGVPWLAERLEQLASLAPEEEEVLWHALAQLGQRMREVQQGQPDPALALLLEQRLLPELEQACTDQAACLSVLDGALAILEQTAPDEGADAPATFVPAQVLARWRHTAGQIHEAMHTLWTALSLQRQQPSVSSQVVAQHLHLAWEHVQTLWQEVGALQEALGAALGVLGTLLMRTLPPSPDASGVANAGAAVPAFPASSPLRQSVGTILKHQEICHHVVHVLEQAVQTVDALLGEDQEQALLALSDEMVSLLAVRQCDQAHQDEAACTRQTESLAPSIPLTTGVSLIPGSVMDTHYLEMQSMLHQALHEYHAQALVTLALGEQQATHAGSLALSFWRLVQGDGLLWASLLVRLIEEQLPTGPDDAQLRAWLTQLQGLFHGEPQERLQALLTELAEQLPADSPLQRPCERFTRLLQQQTDVFVREALLALTEEVQGQAERDAWPADRVSDLRWVLEVLCGYLQAAEDDRAALLLNTLVHLIETRQGVPAATGQETPDGEMEVLLASLAGMTDGQARLRIIQHLLAALPEQGPQPARADPRANPWWRFHLLRELLDALLGPQATAVEPALDLQTPGLAADEVDDSEPRPLLEPVTALVVRLLVAWRFPAEGYFRDPYNDASILWVSTGLFWPMIAQGIAEPLEEEALAHSNWHCEEGDIPAQIPVDHACKLSECLATRTPQLPAREQLARWGTELPVEEDGPWSVQHWHTHLTEQRRALLAFLEGAILREEPIFCSL